jgi:hypothetical protein
MSHGHFVVMYNIYLTLILLTLTIWRAPTNTSKWRMGFNSAFKGLINRRVANDIHYPCVYVFGESQWYM